MKSIFTFAALLFTVSVSYAAGPAPVISQQEVLDRLNSEAPVLILDVRSESEFADGHLPNAMHIPHNKLNNMLDSLDKYRDVEVIVYCEGGPRAYKAEKELISAGFNKVKHLDGDMAAWRSRGLPQSK